MPTEEGTTPRAALFQANKVGILGTDGQRYRIGAYHSLLPSTSPETLIEQAIAMLAQPVIAAVPWPANWYNRLTYPGGILPTPPQLHRQPRRARHPRLSLRGGPPGRGVAPPGSAGLPPELLGA